jgi:hypothetical protein
MKLFFSKNGYGTHHTQKIHVILSKCDHVIENIQIHMWWPVLFFGLNFFTNVKNKYEKGIFYHFYFFGEKNHYICKKIENHVGSFKKCLDMFLEHVII